MTGIDRDIFTVHAGDSRHLGRLLDQIPEPKGAPITCTITSPPYGALKDYGHPDQIGFGQPYEEYLVEMRRMFRAIYQRTTHDGSMWVIADTLRGDETRLANIPQRLEPLPFHLAQEAAEAGWVLRETIIWQKQKTLPWSSGRRLRNSFEYVFLFVKSSDYKFHVDRLRDPVNLEEWWVKWPERYNPTGKIPTNVWEIPIPQQGTWAGSTIQHACPLPPDLVERLIFLSTDPGDVVFDPFAGTGVVVAEAQRLGRRGIGIELNPAYVRAYKREIQTEVGSRNRSDELLRRMQQGQDLRERIIRLRAIKYPKVLWQRLIKENDLAIPRFLLLQVGKVSSDTMKDATKPLSLKTFFVYDDQPQVELENVERALKVIANRAPATKFGVVSEIHALNQADLDVHLRRERLFVYTRGHTWDADGQVKRAELPLLTPTAGRKGQYTYPPIVANVELHETPGQRPDVI